MELGRRYPKSLVNQATSEIYRCVIASPKPKNWINIHFHNILPSIVSFLLSDRARIDERSLHYAHGHEGLIPLTSDALKKPCILRRKRRRSEQENFCPKPKLILPSPTPKASEPESKQPVIGLQSQTSNLTPLKTPVKHLPFSPSQVIY